MRQEEAQAFSSFDTAGKISFEDLYGKTFAIETVDPRYDDLLVASHRMGGDLNEQQKARLRMLGYQGDAESRLMELLAEPHR